VPFEIILFRLFSKYDIDTTYRSLIKKKEFSFLVDSLETEINLLSKQLKYLSKYMWTTASSTSEYHYIILYSQNKKTTIENEGPFPNDILACIR